MLHQWKKPHVVDADFVCGWRFDIAALGQHKQRSPLILWVVEDVQDTHWNVLMHTHGHPILRKGNQTQELICFLLLKMTYTSSLLCLNTKESQGFDQLKWGHTLK